MKAPGCHAPVLFYSYLSGNNFGARAWTDGCHTSIFQDEPLLQKSSDGVMFWVDECEEIGRMPPDEERTIFGMKPFEIEEFGPVDPYNTDLPSCFLEHVERPSARGYVVALKAGLGNTPEREIHIRKMMWWLGNNRIRKDKNAKLSKVNLESLEIFKELLSENDPNQRLMKAEVLRHLSRFDEALNLLEYDFPERQKLAVKVVTDLALRGHNKVARIK